MQLQRVISEQKKWIPQLDGLRFIAIFAVLAAHTLGQMASGQGRISLASKTTGIIPPWAFWVTGLGRSVSLFFVISGFILGAPFVAAYVDRARPIDIKRFYLRRLTRLEPPYIISLLLYFAIHASGFGTHYPAYGTSLLTSLFYVKNLFRNLPPLNPPNWSLEVEIQFYLLAPLLATIFLIRKLWIRTLLLSLLILASAIPTFASFNNAGFYLPSQLCFFLAGFLLADLRINQGSTASSFRDLLAALCLLAYFTVPLRWGALPQLILLCVFVPMALSGPLSRRLLGYRWIALLGGMCYSIYLVHMLVLSVVWKLTRHFLTHESLALNYAIQLTLLIPAIVLVAVGFYVAIERPCMDPRWPQKLLIRIRELASAIHVTSPINKHAHLP